MQTTEEFYNAKTDRELFKILKGNYAYNQKLHAEKILKERNFDFDNVEKYRNEWELEKLENEIKEEKQNVITSFEKSAFGFDMFAVFPMVFLLGIIYLLGHLIFQIFDLTERAIFDTVLGLCFLIILEFVFIYLFKRRKKKRMERAERIAELKEKIK